MYCHYIGVVEEIRGEDLEQDDIIFFQGEYRSISAVKKQGNIVRISFNFRRSAEDWDVDVEKEEKIYRLGTHRITGMKGEEL